MNDYSEFEISVIENEPPLRVECEERYYNSGWNTQVKLYDCYKISILFTDGMAALKGAQIFNLSSGDLVVFRPEEVHFARILRSGVHHYLTLLVPMELMRVCGGDALTRMFTDADANRVNHITPPPEARVEILRRGEQMLSLLDERPDAWELRIFACFVELLAVCQPLYDNQKQHPETSAASAVVTAALRCINTRYAELRSLSEIADEVGCSVTYLTRLFRRHTGKTVHGYLTECRIVHAKRFLESGTSVTEVCYRTGFSDCSAFIRVFRESEGITPLQYKKRYEE